MRQFIIRQDVNAKSLKWKASWVEYNQILKTYTYSYYTLSFILNFYSIVHLSSDRRNKNSNTKHMWKNPRWESRENRNAVDAIIKLLMNY